MRFMEAKPLEFLKRLSESFGPSGFEREPVSIVKQYVQPFADEIKSDKLGSLHFAARGKAAHPVIILPGHVDEVGFIVSGTNAHGFLTFNAIGGWFDQVLLCQKVKIRTAKEMGIRIGDPVVPDSPFYTIEKNVFRKPEGGGEEKAAGRATLACGKAFDDRIGAFIAAEVVRKLKEGRVDHPNTVIGAATVQEEVGLRGARTTAFVTQPDVCITLEVDIAGDVPGIEPHEAPTKMGFGPAVITYDASLIPNQGLKEFLISTAEELGVPLQLSQMKGGGTDGGAIHMANAGCPTVVLTVPTRHIHSHVGMLSLDDVDNAIALLMEVVKRLDGKTAEAFTAI